MRLLCLAFLYLCQVMPPNRKRQFTSLVLVCFLAVGLLGWYLLSRDSGEAPPLRPSAPAKIAGPPAGQRKTGPAPAATWPEFGTPEFNKMVLERGAAWLATRGRDAASLVAAWDITGDTALLDEAAEKFPNDPRVCIAMIARLSAENSDALPWIERFIALEPNNPEGHFLKIGPLMKAGDRDAALASLRRAVETKGKRDLHLRERMVTIREAALASGAGIRDAARLAIAGPNSRGATYGSFNGLIKLLHGEIESAKSAGDHERLIATASLGLGASEQFRATDDRTLINDLATMTLQRFTLAELPDDMEYGTTGQTIGERRLAVAQQTEELKTFLKQGERLEALREQASDSQMAGYSDQYFLHGEKAAWEWLAAQMEQKK